MPVDVSSDSEAEDEAEEALEDYLMRRYSLSYRGSSLCANRSWLQNEGIQPETSAQLEICTAVDGIHTIPR